MDGNRYSRYREERSTQSAINEVVKDKARHRKQHVKID